MVFIKKILWFDVTSEEAQVIVSDGEIDVICFSHPFTRKLLEPLHTPVCCLDISHIVISKERAMCAIKNGSYWGYWVRGKLLHRKLGKVCVGKIILEVDASCIPCDIIDGAVIEFEVSRFDLI